MAEQQLAEKRPHGAGHEPNVPTPRTPMREPVAAIVERRANEFLAQAEQDVGRLPALTADQVRELRILLRAYQLANVQKPVSGETLIEIHVLHHLRQRVSTVALGSARA